MSEKSKDIKYFCRIINNLNNPNIEVKEKYIYLAIRKIDIYDCGKNMEYPIGPVTSQTFISTVSKCGLQN